MTEKCSYGCGNDAKFFFKYVKKWCCSENKMSCPVIREKISKSKKGKNRKEFSEETRQKMSQSSKGKKKSIEHIKKMSNSLKGKLVGEKNGMFGKFHSNETKKIIGEKTKNWIQQNNGKSAFYGKNHSNEAKNKMSDSHKKLFRDPIFVEEFKKKNLKNKISIPNKQEIIIINLLNEIIPKKYIFTGDFSLWINGKNPDFINEDEKKIIEFFGKNWHKEEDEINRIDHFKKEGYKTLVIWDYEMKNMKLLKEKIINFSEEN